MVKYYFICVKKNYEVTMRIVGTVSNRLISQCILASLKNESDGNFSQLENKIQ